MLKGRLYKSWLNSFYPRLGHHGWMLLKTKAPRTKCSAVFWSGFFSLEHARLFPSGHFTWRHVLVQAMTRDCRSCLDSLTYSRIPSYEFSDSIEVEVPNADTVDSQQQVSNVQSSAAVRKAGLRHNKIDWPSITKTSNSKVPMISQTFLNYLTSEPIINVCSLF